jgi:hypothetical protein
LRAQNIKVASFLLLFWEEKVFYKIMVSIVENALIIDIVFRLMIKTIA